MSSPSEQSAVRALIDPEFNSLLTEAFLCGLYTLLFGYTLRTLLQKPNKKAYAAVLTVLWVVVMLSFAFDWQYHRAAFVIDNNSPLDINNALNGPSVKPLGILDNFFSMCCNLLADALLIWRCYMLWEDKRWVLLPLPILLIAAVVFGNFFIALQVKDSTLDHLKFLASFFGASVATTFMGTSLIILRILLVTRHSPLTNHTSAYRKIQRILVESGIIYSVAMFISGVALGIQLGSHQLDSESIEGLTIYAEAILVPLSGIGPTLIAVRIGHEAGMQTDTGTSRTRHHSRALSHLTFRRTVRQNGTFDIEGGVAGRDDSPINSSAQEEGPGGHTEKMATHTLGTTV